MRRQRFGSAVPQLAVIARSGSPSSPCDMPPFPTSVARKGVLVVLIGIAALASWAALAPISGAVVTEGVVVADGARKTVQHLEGGIVQTIHVRDGDHVISGQALITLDDVRVGAELDAGQTELDAELALADRLTAEREYGPAIRFGSTLTARRAEVRVANLMQRETAAFAARRRELDEQIALTRTQVDETQGEIGSLLGSVDTTQTAHRIAKAEYETYEKLKEQGFISDIRLLELKRNQTDYLAKSQAQQTELAKAREKRTELVLKIAALKNDYLRKAEDELKDATTRIFKLQQQLRPLADAAHRHVITAPIAGEVVDLKVHTLGAAIGPREPVLDIAPADAQLIVEARIKPENVEDVHPGGRADVRLTAYKQRNSAMLEGRLVYLGADRLTDKLTNQPYYPAHIEITPGAIEQAQRASGTAMQLAAGMGVEAFIKTQGRTAFDYWLEPIVNGARRSMREK